MSKLSNILMYLNICIMIKLWFFLNIKLNILVLTFKPQHNACICAYQNIGIVIKIISITPYKTYYCKIVICVNVWTITNKNTRYYYKKCSRDVVMVFFYLPFVFRLLPSQNLLKIVTPLPSSL